MQRRSAQPQPNERKKAKKWGQKNHLFLSFCPHFFAFFGLGNPRHRQGNVRQRNGAKTPICIIPLPNIPLPIFPQRIRPGKDMVTGTIWQGNNRAVASFPSPDIDSPDKSFPK